MTRPPIDWPALAVAVVPALCGDPTRKGNRDWRWGRRQSLSLNLETGRLYDFETKSSMGLLDFVCRENSLADHAAAMEWLKGHRFLPDDPPQAGSSAHRQPQRAFPSPASQPAPDPDASPSPGLPFWQADLPRLNYAPIPDDPAHPLNRWAVWKCARPAGTGWPDGCRWLKGWHPDPERGRAGGPAWGGAALMAPLARPEAWLRAGGLSQRAVMGIHAVLIDDDGRSRRLPDGRNKTDWCNERSGSLIGCGVMVGQPAFDGSLSICEGLADALALHWHLDTPVLAACGSLSGLVPVADELAYLTRWPLQLSELHIWPDQDTQANPHTQRKPGPNGAMLLQTALRLEGVPKSAIVLREFGRPGQDPCEWLAGLAA